MKELEMIEAAVRNLVESISDCTCAPFWKAYDKTDPTCMYHDNKREIEAARNALRLIPGIRERIASLERSDLAEDLRVARAEFSEERRKHDLTTTIWMAEVTQYAQAHKAEVAAKDARIAVLKRGLAKSNGVSHLRALDAYAQRVAQLEAALPKIREQINQCFGGMHSTSALWSNSNNSYDKGWTSGVLAAITAFDTAAARALAPEPKPAEEGIII